MCPLPGLPQGKLVSDQPPLQIFTKKFFSLKASCTNRNDITLYQVFAYLSFFRLEELQTSDFRRLVLSQEPSKMNVFLLFAFDADNLREHLREDWMTVYDYQYIDDKIIGGVERNLPSITDILKHVEKRATGKVTSTLSMTSSQANDTIASQFGRKDSTVASGAFNEELNSEKGDDERVKKTTEFKPFNLTKPKPKIIPMPEVVKREIKANPVPKNLFNKKLADIEKDKKDRRMARVNSIKKEYEGGQKQRFALATETRPSVNKLDRTKAQLEEQTKQTLKFGDFKARDMPNFDKKDAQVKLNIAALKREKHLIDKEDHEEKVKVAEMAMGLKDSSEFIRWQREMEQKDDIEKLEHIQKKKIEMEMAREEAILAQQRKEKENNKLAQQMKKESEKREVQREKNAEEMIAKNKEVIVKVHEQKAVTTAMVQANKAEKKRIRDEVNKELQEAAKRKKDEMAAELAKKEELIRQIRELEKIPIQRTKGFDPTEAGGHGLMIEMSVAELRERLEYNKRQQQQEIDFKRETNLLAKEQEAAKLVSEAKMIEEARQKRKAANDARRNKKAQDAATLAQAKQAAREKGLLEVYEKINKKKKDKQEEDERLAKELKEIKLQRQYLNANAAMVEEKAWKELEAGKERQVRNNQNERLIDQCKSNQIKVKDLTVMATNNKTAVQDKLQYDHDYAQRLNTRKKENEVLHKNTLEYKSQMHAKQKLFEDDLKVKTKKAKPFNAKINAASLAQATAYKNKSTTLVQDETLDLEDHGDFYNEHQEDNSALDMLGEAERAVDDIQAKLEME